MTYMYRQLCVNLGVKNTMATCFSQFNNNYISICVSSVFSHIHVEGNWKRQHLYPVIPIKQNKKGQLHTFKSNLLLPKTVTLESGIISSSLIYKNY